MHHSCHVKSRAVRSLEEDWKHRRARLSNDAGYSEAPSRIGDRASLKIEMGNLARGEDDEHAAVLHPLYAFPYRPDIFTDRRLPLERVHRDQHLPHFWYGIEQIISHELHIASEGAEDRRQDDAFNSAEGGI